MFNEALLLFPLALAVSTTRVTIPLLGEVEGGFDTSLNGTKFYSFEGIPYAEPPVGKHRFKKPIPRKSWDGIWVAKTQYKCLQYSQQFSPFQDPILGEEDCLYLNVYTPTLDKDANLDVLVHIHGGAFMFLYAGYFGPRFFMDKNVVFVSLNYRLGPLGFLSTEDDIVPGNNGIWDQILALKWVKDNIKYFGGNPNSVTIFGISAGGASTHIHYVSPKSKGLFQKGMSLSGTALSPWALTEKPLEKAKKLAAGLGCPTRKNDEMIDCLRHRPGRQIVSSVKDFLVFLYNPCTPFGVVVDSWSSDPILPEHPYLLLKKGKVNDLPWILSHTDFEGLYPAATFFNEKILQQVDDRWNELLPFLLDFNSTVDPNFQNQVSKKIRKEYLKDDKLNESNLLNFINMFSHRYFDIDIQKSAKLQAASTSSQLYFYLFQYRGSHSWIEHFTKRKSYFGAAHGDDGSFMLSSLVDVTSNNEDRKMVDFFIQMITSFAATGNPEVGIQWTPVSKTPQNGIEVLRIKGPDNLAIDRVQTPMEEFWASLPIVENEKLFKNVKTEL